MRNKKRPEFALCLAATSAYWRYDRKRHSRHISYRSSTLEPLIRRLNAITKRQDKARFPWHLAFIFKNYPGDYSKETECILTTHFKKPIT
jgi:hypothetical protein